MDRHPSFLRSGSSSRSRWLLAVLRKKVAPIGTLQAQSRNKSASLFSSVARGTASTATRTSGACGRSLAAKSKDAKPQLVYYEVGVNGFLGGVFGQGFDDNIRLAYDWLVENYNDGDEVFIFGFSRGAFTARSLAGLIAIDGILKAGAPIGVSELFDRYKKGNEKSIWTLKEMEASGDTSRLTEQEKWLLKYFQPAGHRRVGHRRLCGPRGWRYSGH